VVRKKAKEGSDATDREYLAGQLVSAVGFDDITTVRTDDGCTLASYVEGRPAAEMSVKQGPLFWRQLRAEAGAEEFDRLNAEEQARFTSPEGRRIGILDWLVDNNDRHDGNFIVKSDGSVRPIDQGMATFYGPSMPHELEHGRTARGISAESRFAEPMYVAVEVPGHPDRTMNVPVTSIQELANLRVCVEAHRGDFARAGRMDWYNAVLQRLDLMGQVATEDGALPTREPGTWDGGTQA
jgi:hypothetical protein